MIVEERTSRVAPNGCSKRRRVSTNQSVHSDLYINLEISSGSTENIPIEEVFKQLKCTREQRKERRDSKSLAFNKLEEKKAQLFLDFFISN
ncbi:hypothetical protein RHMOL_Rhmol10G0105400 [Rhododendron molle]|uniref:Uncharacterized protein n=1 Tax=Rhododendron molle TaxID=49168 RepID=A0ACC0M0Q9_RHOML|nr:hypothetical protein RHMOL_Rhmol10G0105400 [Rhododendron molle]